ncbi:MAG: hypothetical protein J6R13_00350 [Alistipes sp.]|nr:hypothetical protein [Alistipes sp.]
MLKKLSLLTIAFAIGVMVSLSIQACADDYNESPEPNKTESSSDTRDFSPWKNNGVESIITYDGNGQISSQINYTYNNKGWLTKSTNIGYSNNSGVRYKISEYIYTYTYSSSGDIQYSSHVFTAYDQYGQITYQQRSSIETRLRR